MYVEELIGPETVNTLPPDTLELVQDHGCVALTLESDIGADRRVLSALADVRIDYEEITATLEHEGVQKFVDSFHELFDDIEAKRDELTAQRSS